MTSEFNDVSVYGDDLYPGDMLLSQSRKVDNTGLYQQISNGGCLKIFIGSYERNSHPNTPRASRGLLWLVSGSPYSMRISRELYSREDLFHVSRELTGEKPGLAVL